MGFERPQKLAQAVALLRASPRTILAGGTDLFPATTKQTLMASPAADGVPPLLVLDAEVELASAKGLRSLPLSEFILGNRRTALETGEVLTAVLIPNAALGGRSHFVKLGARKHLVISIAMVAARLDVNAGRIRRAAISVGSCSEVAVRLPGLEEALRGVPARDALGAVNAAYLAPSLSPIDDIRADHDYRIHAAVELVKRAVSGVAQ